MSNWIWLNKLLSHLCLQIHGIRIGHVPTKYRMKVKFDKVKRETSVLITEYVSFTDISLGREFKLVYAIASCSTEINVNKINPKPPTQITTVLYTLYTVQ